MISPLDNKENVKYYLMRCTKRKMKLFEEYDDKGFIYERGSIILKDYFFQETHQSENYIYFQDYGPNVICFQYIHLVCVARIKLIEVPLKKKLKTKRWKVTKVYHE